MSVPPRYGPHGRKLLELHFRKAENMDQGKRSSAGEQVGVTQIITVDCHPDAVADVEAATCQWIASASNVEGHCGAGVFCTRPGDKMRVHVVRQFETMQSLEASGAADASRALRASVESSTQGDVDERIVPGMQNWLDLATLSREVMPTRFKMTVLMFLGMFPISIGIHHLWKHFPQMMELPALVNAGLMTAAVTIVTMNLAMPLLMYLFSGWFDPGADAADC